METEELGGYRLIEQLGSGGMGVVYLGVDGEGSPVAVKVLHPHISGDETARKRLAREVRTLRRIHHPRIAEVLDAELDSDRPFIVTEFVDGTTLSADVKANGPFAEDELVHFGHALLDALSAVHAAGVIHRDLKPANVMIMDGEPMVIDFGIAQVADEVKVTATGLVMGTPGYLSPEIADGKASSEKTDWWGWAATMVYAATGRNPYGSGPLEAVLGRVAMGKVDLEGVPAGFVPLLRACLEPKPERRPSGAMILQALVDIESGRVPELGGGTRAQIPQPGEVGGIGEAMGQPRPTHPGAHTGHAAALGGAAGGAAVAGPGAFPGAQPGSQSHGAFPAGGDAALPGRGAPQGHSGPGPYAGAPGRPGGRASAASTQVYAPAVREPVPAPQGSPPAGRGPAGYGPQHGGQGYAAGQGRSGERPYGALTLNERDRLSDPQGGLPAGGYPQAQQGRFDPHYGQPGGGLSPRPGGGTWLLLGLNALGVALAALGPFVVLVVAGIWQVLARTAGRLSAARRRRLAEYGPQGASGWSSAAKAPGAVIGSLFTSVFSSLLPLIAAAAAAVLVRLDVLGIVPVGRSVEWSIWAAAGVFGLVLWLGPGSANLRRGSRALVAPATRTSGREWIWTGVLLLLAAIALGTVLGGAATLWWPLPQSPFDFLPQPGG
ncbi:MULTISPECIES: serine/threonine-protein kinase [Brevibacterium]|uniref:Protein kinase domain-containing protein n=1 Tax=Brevibacterium salitolerans TaxID=1403566 RepID=A0ABP5I4L7_9MICO|nr:serine/threonine-protein kinase [Brevibacterium sp.]